LDLNQDEPPTSVNILNLFFAENVNIDSESDKIMKFTKKILKDTFPYHFKQRTTARSRSLSENQNEHKWEGEELK